MTLDEFVKQKREMKENLNTNVEDKARETLNPVYADTMRRMKETDKRRKNATKLSSDTIVKEPKPVKNELLRKMHLSESLFETNSNLITEKNEPNDAFDNLYDDLRKEDYILYAPINGKSELRYKPKDINYKKLTNTYNDYKSAEKILNKYNLKYDYKNINKNPYILVQLDTLK